MTSSLLHHELVPFSGPGGFVAAATDSAADALAGGSIPVIVAAAEQLAEIRDALGENARTVVGIDRSLAGRNPARLIPAFQHHVDASNAAVHCIGEPARPDDPQALRAEMALHDLMLQLPAFRSWDCRVTCAYDAGLHADVVAELADSHRPHSDPEDAVDRLRARPLPPRPPHSEELGVDRTTLNALRGFIEERATLAGLDEERVDDLVYAVNEVVTNSICHGEGRARVNFWVGDDGSVTCEVRDRGWVRDPLAGRVAPDPDRPNGRGLWLVNQLCDLVQLRSSPAGTTLRLHIDG
jgi:anti-sigma regulatory factor (Ser/Thr protein kinase)